MSKKLRKAINIILAVAMIVSILPVLGGVASAQIDLARPAVFTYAEGNVARAGTAIAQYTNGHQPTDAATRVNNGASGGATHANSWNSFGFQGTFPFPTVWIDIRWDEIYTVDSMRVMWSYDGTAASSGVQLPNAAIVQYWDGTQYVNVTNMTDPAGVPVTSVGILGSGTNEANDIWNGVRFDPVSTDRLRLVITQRRTSATASAGGAGISEWEIFGVQDPLTTALAWARGQIGSLANLVTSVALPTTHTIGDDVFTFSYVSSNPAIFAPDGTVTRPAIGEDDASGTLTVTATLGEEYESQILNWSVRRLLSDYAIVTSDMAWIGIGSTTNRTTNFSLPTIGPEGATITWDSGGSEYLWADGTVLRPPQGQAAVAEVLTATVAFGEVELTRSWTVTIQAWPEGGRRIVSHEPVVIEQPRLTAPKLPNEVMVTYSDGNSEMRRVRWGRNSVSNQQTDANRAVGVTYNITGNVMGDGNGDGFVVTANITVVSADRVNDNVPSRQPVARALPLTAVTIDPDPNGAANILTQNRTGWTSYIVGQDVTRFIHPFRTAYGLSTAGYTPPTGWVGKLRGFGSGHYMSALAMAYSTPTLTTTQRNTLIRNMERMTRELRFVQEMTMYVPHPTEDRYWEGRDFMGDIHLDGTPFVTAATPANIAHLRDRPGDWQVMRMATSPWGTLSNWLSYASSNNPNEGPRSYGHGYLNAIPPHHLVGNEAYLGYNDTGNGIWAPFYGLHKIFAGLLEIYYLFDGDPATFNITNAAGAGLEAGQTAVTIEAQQLAENALEIAKDMGLWIENRWSVRSRPGYAPNGTNPANNFPGYRDTIWGQYIAGEYGAINESLARLAVITGDYRFMDGAQVFWNDGNTNAHGGIPFFTSLANNLDSIRRLHANTHIPMIVGSVWAFRASDDPTFGPMYWRMAENFLDYNVGRYSWATGNVKGHTANIETYVGAYNQVPELHTHTGANETCANYNLMKLNKYLNEHNPTNAKYLDHIEKLFTCQMVGSTRVGNSSGSNTYHYPVHLNASRGRGTSLTPDATCCAGTAIENHVKYQDAIYFESLDAYGKSDGRVLYVGLYMPSTMQWRDESGALRATIRQATVWPSERSVFTVTPAGGGTVEFEMLLRVPAWATSDFDITVGGVSIAALQPDGVFTPSTYATTGVRTWAGTAADEVVVTMPFDFWIDFLPTRHTNGRWVGAMMYGPVLMAARGVTSWQTLDVDSFLSTGPGTNITLNGTTTLAAGVAGTNAPNVAVNNAHTMTMRVGNNTFTLFPHYILEPSHTTYFYIRYIDENVADRNALFAMLSYAAPFLAGNFTPETLAGLQSAISAAVLVYQNVVTTDAQLNAQIALVDAAVDALEAEGEADKTELIAAIEAAAGREEVDYTWDSWAAFVTQRNAAIALVGNEYATQGAVISQTNALIAATDGLVATASLNRDALNDAKETAANQIAINLIVPEADRQWPEHIYSTFTYRSTRALLAVHEEVLALPDNANQSEINLAATALNTAILGLLHYTLADERQLLRDVVDEVIELAESIEAYTQDSQDAILWMLEWGEDRFIYASLTFIEKHSTIADFREIIDGLTLLGVDPADYGAVNAALAAVEALDRDTVKYGLDALDAAIAAIDWNLSNAQQAVVDGYAAAINAAFDNLVFFVTSVRLDLAAITRVARNSTREVAILTNPGACPEDVAGIILTTSNQAMATIGADGRSVTTLNRAGTVTLTATVPGTALRHSVTLMIT